MTLLSNTSILRHLFPNGEAPPSAFPTTGAIVISPFDPSALGNVSYDLTLGDTIARYRPEREWVDLYTVEPASMFKIEPASPPFGVSGERFGFYLAPGERVLGHSREVVGGRQVECFACCGFGERLPPTGSAGFHECAACRGKGTVAVTTQLHATSTAARIGLSICQCAGWGDVSYLDRWTLEIQNHSPRALWIPVGAVLCQISFEEVEPILHGTAYDKTGRYAQTSENVNEIHATWTPERMLPKHLKVRK